jgi:hypothetical protein
VSDEHGIADCVRPQGIRAFTCCIYICPCIVLPALRSAKTSRLGIRVEVSILTGMASVALIEARREQNKVSPYSESLGTCYRLSMASAIDTEQTSKTYKYTHFYIQQINMRARLSSADPNRCRHLLNASTRGSKP